MGAAEVPFVLAFLTAVVAAQLALSSSFDLFSRQFWLDEVVTYVTATDRSLKRSIRAIASGLDTNPPGYHLLLRGFLKLVGRTEEATLRLFAGLCLLAALTGLYANVRLVYSPLVAITVVLTTWQHPLVLRFAFEARMYGAWLAATVWFSYALACVGASPAEPWLLVLLGGTGLVTCATHTLGPLVIGLVVGGYLLCNYSATVPWLMLSAAGLGPIAFLAWTPFLRMQDTAHPVSWINPPTARTIVRWARRLALPDHVGAAVLLAGGFAPLLPNMGLGHGASAASRSDWKMLAGLAALALLPFALVFLSYIAQPLLHERYAFPAVAAFAPAIAFVISPVPTFWVLVLSGLLFLSGAYEIHQLATGYRLRDRQLLAHIRALRELTRPNLVLFETLREFSVVWRYAPDLRGRCFMLDFESGELGAVSALRLSSRNQARIFERFYPEWATLPWATLRKLPRFYLVARPAQEDRFREPERPYPGFVATSLGAGLYDLSAGPHAEA
jgi:hypothetical protein